MPPRPRLACSELVLGGAEERWEVARRAGMDGVEVYGSGAELAARVSELRRRQRAGLRVPIVCTGAPFLGRQTRETADAAVDAIRHALAAARELEAAGVVVALALPPGSAAQDGLLPSFILDALATLAAHAEAEGVGLNLEPLNRYEDGVLNRLDQAVAVCEAIGSDALGVVADLFHMNIEERDLCEALRRAGTRLRHVHVADSDRGLPGGGHLTFSPLLTTLAGIGYDGWLSFECRIDEPAATSLRAAREAIERAWPASHTIPPSSPGRCDQAPSSLSAVSGVHHDDAEVRHGVVA